MSGGGLEPPYHDNSHHGGIVGGLYMQGNQELYTGGSVYNTNLDKLARVFVKSTEDFTTVIVRSISNMVYRAQLCRGDIMRSDYVDYITIAFQNASQICIGYKAADHIH